MFARSLVSAEVHRQPQNQAFALTVEELDVFIAVMYKRGVTGKSFYDIWTEGRGLTL